MLEFNKLNIADNFISKETANSIHNYLKDKTHVHDPDGGHPNGVDRFPIYFKGESVFFDQPGIDEDGVYIFDLIKLIGESVGSYFNLPKDDISLRGMTYTTYNVDQGLPAHDDWKVTKHDVYSAVLYLNDDFEGGEFIWYTKYDNHDESVREYIKYNPKAGQLYYFQGLRNPLAVHEVLPVTSGQRACIIFFYAGPTIKDGVDEFPGTWGQS